MLFLDASALVKRYVRERHSARVRRLIAAGPIAVSRLSEVEVPAALARLRREGRLSDRRKKRALAAFVVDFESWYVVELTPAVTALARTRLDQHDLRAGDAIQLASALRLRETLGADLAGVLAFDTRLVGAAITERLMRPERGRKKTFTSALEKT